MTPDRDLVGDLLRALRHPNVTPRLVALKALARCNTNPPDVLPVIVPLLNDIDATVREAAAAALGHLGSAAVPALAAALRHDDRHVRRRAVWALARLGPAAESAVPDLAGALEDADARTAAGAAQALANLGPAAAGAASDLMHALHGSSQVLCRLASKALSAIGPAAVPLLCEGLNDPDPFVRREAALALGWIGAASAVAVPVLVGLIQVSGDGAVLESPRRSAQGLSSCHRTPIAPCPPQEQVPLRLCAIQALGRIGAAARPAVPLLLAALSDPVPVVRDAANEALALIRRG
jgi:HEAT repeat protein